MNRILFSIAVFCCLISTHAALAQSPAYPAGPGQNYPPEVLQKIKDVENHLAGWVQPPEGAWWGLTERMAYHRLHGLSIAVIHNYKIEWVRAYGWADTATHRPVTPETLFQAASISKSLNGVGVLRLVQEHRLDLYADINNYLSTWKFPYDSLSKGKKISAANLLSHTAGLSVHGFAGYAHGDSIPDIYQVLDGRRPANSPAIRSMFEPGLRSEYSGGGVTISQLMVMEITHEAYDKYMWQNVLRPMGMTASFYTQPAPEDKRSLLATGYRGGGNEVKGKDHIYPEQAAAGLWTNPTDLARYIIETQLSYEGRSAKVLSQAMTIQRLTPYVDSNAAMGVFIMSRGGRKYFSHGGANEGFRSQYYGSLSDGDGVVIMVNSDNGAILSEIVNSVATVYHWKDFYQPVIKRDTTVAGDILQTYTGSYTVDGDTVRVLKKDQSLWLDVGFDQWQLHFTSLLNFYMYDDRGDFQFIKEADGRISGIKINNNRIAKRIAD